MEAMLRLRILLSCLGVLTLLLPAARSALADPPVAAPITLFARPGPGGFLLLDGSLNGQPCTFLLDTGTQVTTVTARFVARFSLFTQTNAGTTTLLGPSPLRIGPLTVDALNPEVLARTADPSLEQLFDAILGMDVLSRYGVLLDFQQRRITLWPGGALSAQQRRQIGMEAVTRVALTPLGGTDCVGVPVSVNATPPQLYLLDTGASYTTIDTRVAQRLKLPALTNSLLEVGVEGRTAMTLVRVDTLSVGGLIDRLHTVDYDPTGARPHPPALGQSWLMQYRLLFDFPQHQLYFRRVPQQSFTTPFADLGPLNSVESLPFVNVTLPDRKPHRFALEPAYSSCVDTHLASTLRLPAEADRDSPLHAEQGTLHCDARLFGEEDLSAYMNNSTGEGILGRDLLDQYAVEIDVHHRQVTFLSPGHLLGTPEQPANATRLPMTLTAGGYAVTGTVDGHAAQFVVNLYASETLLQTRALVAQLQPSGTLAWIGDPEAGRELRLHRIEIGGLAWDTPRVTDRTGSVDYPVNVLGQDFLQRFHLVLDYAGEGLYLTRDPSYKEAPDQGNAGIQAQPTADHRLIISAIGSPSSAQEAGLQVGDEIVSMNGLEVASTPFDTLHAQFPHTLGTTVVVVVQRKGETKPREVKLVVRKW